MASVVFDYTSRRAQKARIGRALSGMAVRLMPLLAGLFVAAGLALVVMNMAAGWLVAGIAALPFMVFRWYHGELHHLPSASGDTVDAVLSGDILGQLPKDPSPADIATAVGRVQSGQFFGVRFGISPRFLQEVASAEGMTADAIWRAAYDVQREAGVPRISGSVLGVALLRCFPNHEGLLAPLQLSDSDLLEGVRWQQHIRDIVSDSKRPRRTGGIARDW